MSSGSNALPAAVATTSPNPSSTPKISRTYAAVPCGSKLCRSVDASGCDNQSHSCLYRASYVDGSSTTGHLSTETHLSRRCPAAAHCRWLWPQRRGPFIAAAGFLSLGRGRLSFTFQTRRRFGRTFSYCRVIAAHPKPLKRKISALVYK